MHEDKLLMIDSLGYSHKNLIRANQARFTNEKILVVSQDPGPNSGDCEVFVVCRAPGSGTTSQTAQKAQAKIYVRRYYFSQEVVKNLWVLL